MPWRAMVAATAVGALLALAASASTDATAPCQGMTTSPSGLTLAEAAGARLMPPHSDHGLDQDGDGLNEALVVKVIIEVFVEDLYGVRGTLRDGTGSVDIAYWSGSGVLQVGVRHLYLDYSGESILQSGIDGPYLINDLTLYLVSGWKTLDQGEYTTQAYSHEDFEVAATFLPPSAPLSLVASAGDGYVSLSWHPPETNGTSPVQLYNVYRGAEPGSLSALTEVWGKLDYNDTGLTNGCTYYYQVSARNILLEGPCSAEVSATPTGDSESPQDGDPSSDDPSSLASILVVAGVASAAAAVAISYILKRRNRGKGA